jgi:hypothetical protein
MSLSGWVLVRTGPQLLENSSLEFGSNIVKGNNSPLLWTVGVISH